MSEMQVVMNLEYLPNEIFIEYFEYLNAPEIFYSFDQLNDRFSKLIRTIPLHLGCQYFRQSIFDQFCTKMLSTPEIQRQIRSLHLSNDNTCVLIQVFLLFFSLNQFSHLRSLTLTQVKNNNVEQLQSMLPLIPELTSFRLINAAINPDTLLSVLPISQFRASSVHTLEPLLTSSDGILSIKNLTISHCLLDQVCYLFRRAPILQYLNVQNLHKNYSSKYTDPCLSDDYAIYLKQLTIESFYDKFDDLSTLLTQTPNLKSLNIFASNNKNMIDAYRWEDFITSSLPRLTTFKLKFSISYKHDISDEFKQFQSDFWLQQHHWYTEYTLDEGLAYIYTIPYTFNRYVLTPHIEKYQNQLMNNVNIFDNVSDLILYQEIILIKNFDHFSNVTSLTLKSPSDLKDSNDDFLKTEHIHSLKTMVNLPNVKHLAIESICEFESSSVLFQLLKETSQLSSIAMELRRLQSFLHNDELCKYLNKKIRKLDTLSYPYNFLNSSDELEEFCQIFSNLEQLICSINRENDLLFLFNHLSKLSIMKINLSTLTNRACFTRWLGDAAQRLQLTIYIEFDNAFSQTVLIWIDRNIN